MAGTRKKTQKGDVQDEPGADQRFTNILKRALNTPPPRKKGEQPKRKERRKDE